MTTGNRVIAGAKGVAGKSPSGAAPAAPPRVVSSAPLAPAPVKADSSRTAAVPAKVDTAASVKPSLSQSEMDYQPPTAKAEDTRIKGRHKSKAAGDDVQKSEKRPEKVSVKRGETMRDIAQRWNTTVPSIMMENNLVRDEVTPGQTLRLPPPNRR